MQKFVIEGGVPLSGTVVPAGNKNGALPILAASLLTDQDVTLRNVPRISDVDAMLALLASLGAAVTWTSAGEVHVNASGVNHTTVDRELGEQIRASFLLAGPLLARFGRAEMPPPGGDVIGRRRLDPHFDAMRALGAIIEVGKNIELSAPRRRPEAMRLPDGRAVRDGHRERTDGGGAHSGYDRDPQCGIGAARSGPGAHARRDGR